ncbi:aromatic amino acid lyase [Colletotrichum cereale]|nr:aromatic amino acid lyase [Colletotrichum cereale]
MATSAHMFSDLILCQWRDPSSSAKVTLTVSGGNLTIADVVAVSRQLALVKLASASIDAIKACSRIISEKITQGEVIYGVNTGLGGSADVRSDNVEGILQSLISHMTCGIVSDVEQGLDLNSNGNSSQIYGEDHPSNGRSNEQQKQRPASVPHSLPLNDSLAATCMSESWMRASLLTRLNSLAGGASGIRVNIAESLMNLLNKDVVPCIPVRGSISASGDLGAPAWIATLMQGKTSATPFGGPQHFEGARRVTRADVALLGADITPISLHAKEGLAIVNGTAVSARVAALAAYESLNLAALSQVLTAMSVKALRGSDESFEPFIARVRLHPGQTDSARNIMAFLTDSRLLNRHDNRNIETLRQDRYSLRAASQWIGPALEDFGLAYDQLTVEFKSVTDNLLVDDTSPIYTASKAAKNAIMSNFSTQYKKDVVLFLISAQT